MVETKYYGSQELIICGGGELSTARGGLMTGRMSFKVQPGMWKEMPQLGEEHPLASFCKMEKRQVRFGKGYWTVLGDYVGCEAAVESEPAYDWDPGTGTEPIEVAKNFVTEIGGKPSDPKNGAIFVDENGEETADDKKGLFGRFRILDDEGELNPFAGLENFLTMNNAVWTKTWVKRRAPDGSPTGTEDRPMNIVSKPPGGSAVPKFGGDYDWLEFPIGFSARGDVFECRQTWMLSGPRGWNDTIYNK